MNTATKHKNKLLLLGVLVALVSMAVSSDLFGLQITTPDFFDAMATKWDLSLKPGKLIHHGLELGGLVDHLK